jgi:glyoxylase-like metal-dependent hydrolase (beta-lactamase superfamily II)
VSEKVTSEVVWLPLSIVNVYMIGTKEAWVLVDAGLRTSSDAIFNTAKEFFDELPPRAVLLTHGHFDHVGALNTLLETWDVPVYAHRLELPYLTGCSEYPPPDPSVGGGMVARLSGLFSNKPIDLGERLKMLPEEGNLPFLPGWRYLPTPGHSPGHVSLFRESDKTLIAGDAFITTKQEALLSALLKPSELHGPPMYFTPDWVSAEKSVKTLAALAPELALTGHGRPMRGEVLRQALSVLAENFKELAVPKQGRYINQPAVTDENGVQWLPPES